jgi:hypothetical protein
MLTSPLTNALQRENASAESAAAPPPVSAGARANLPREGEAQLVEMLADVVDLHRRDRQRGGGLRCDELPRRLLDLFAAGDDGGRRRRRNHLAALALHRVAAGLRR